MFKFMLTFWCLFNLGWAVLYLDEYPKMAVVSAFGSGFLAALFVLVWAEGTAEERQRKRRNDVMINRAFDTPHNDGTEGDEYDQKRERAWEEFCREHEIDERDESIYN